MRIVKPLLTLILFFFSVSLKSEQEGIAVLKRDFLNGMNSIKAEHWSGASFHFSKIQDFNVAIQDYILFYLGKSLLLQGKCDESKVIFKRLLEIDPKSRWAPWAEAQVASTSSCPPLEIPSEEREELLCSVLTGTAEQAECYFLQRDYPQAKDLFKKEAEAVADPKKEIQSLVRLSQSAARSLDYSIALWANQRLRSRYAETDEGKEALEKIAYLHRVSRHYEKAVIAYQHLLRQNIDPDVKLSALESLGWCLYRLERYPEAVQAFDQIVPKKSSRFGLYWKGRSLEEMRKKREAKKVYREIIDLYPASYYAIQGFKRLKGDVPRSARKKWWPQSDKFRWVERKVSLEDSRSLRKIHELRWLGQANDAAVEIRRLRYQEERSLPREASSLQWKDGKYFFYVKTSTAANPNYPLPHTGFLYSEVERTGKKIDPLFLYAIMRQESQFQESAVSRAGAVGLLQIMSETARRLAREAHWAEFHPPWLFDPLTNIELSVFYLNHLHDFWKGKKYLMAASYNAGEFLVKKWLQARPDLSEEEFIEEIPYEETRNYVKRVLTNDQAYHWIYR